MHIIRRTLNFGKRYKVLITNFLAIDFVIKANDKNPQHFELLEDIFKWKLKMYE